MPEEPARSLAGCLVHARQPPTGLAFTLAWAEPESLLGPQSERSITDPEPAQGRLAVSRMGGAGGEFIAGGSQVTRRGKARVQSLDLRLGQRADPPGLHEADDGTARRDVPSARIHPLWGSRLRPWWQDDAAVVAAHDARAAAEPKLEGRNRMRSIASITSIVVGIIMAVAGVVTWVVISTTLADQKITVSDDANCAAGDDVKGPVSAYCQADIIDHHTLKITGGKTYAELDQEDPNRAVAMDSAFLQASLFTSVVAFGVAAMAFVLGIVLTLIGFALRKPARAPATVAT